MYKSLARKFRSDLSEVLKGFEILNITAIKEYAVETFAHTSVGSVGAFFMPIFTFLYGEGPTVILWMLAYMLLITTDWISGYRASRIDGSYASEYGIEGAYRTAYLLIVPVLAHKADLIIGTPNVIFGFTLLAFGMHIWRSMTANVYRAGWDKWIPISVLNWVADEIDHKTARAKKRVHERNKLLKGGD